MKSKPECKRRGGSWSFAAGLLVAGANLTLLACDEEKPTAAAPAPAEATKDGAPGTSAPEGADDERARAEKAEAGKGPSGTCPAGKWRYDYGDAFMRAFVEKNMPNAKLVKTSGSYICEFPSGAKGEATCNAVGGPVINEVAIDQNGMPMTVYTEVNGGSKMQVEISADKIKVKGSDLSNLQMKAKGTLAGQEIPFPMDELVSLFPAGESQMAYKCEGDTLSLLIEAEGLKSDWQKLERAK